MINQYVGPRDEYVSRPTRLLEGYDFVMRTTQVNLLSAPGSEGNAPQGQPGHNGL